MEDEQQTTIAPEISWLEVEYVNHEKDPRWYIIYGGIFLIVAILIILITRSIFSVIVIVLAAIAGLIYSHKKPQKVEYALYMDGFSVNRKEYFFEDFRSFSPIVEHNLKGAILNPIGKLQLPMYLYFGDDNESQVYDILQKNMVIENYSPDLLQRMIDYARF